MKNKNQIRFEGHRGGAALAIRVTPSAQKCTVVGILEEGRISIHLTNKGVDGNANPELTRFLAEILGVALTQIEIVVGLTSQDKIVAIVGMDPKTVQARLLAEK